MKEFFMTILFLRSNPVNPDSRVEKEAAALVSAGHKVVIFAWDRSKNHPVVHTEEVFDSCHVSVYRVGIQSIFGAGFRKNLIPLLKFQFAVCRFISKYKGKFDVIHACDFDTAGISFLVKSKSTRFVYDVFDYYVDSFSVPSIARYLVEKADTYVMDHADAVIICTEERKKQLRYARPKKIVVIHNTPPKIASISADNREKKGTDRIKVVYVGILAYGRDILEVCEFISKSEQFELHIGGFGILEKAVAEYAEKYDNIFFHGKLSYEDTLRLERACDIFIALYDPKIPNHKYAAPNKFYEALMLGKPLVMAEDTGMSEVVKYKKLGCIIHYNDPGKGLLALVKSKKKWKEISAKEFKLYEEQYSWDTMKERLINLYEMLS